MDVSEIHSIGWSRPEDIFSKSSQDEFDDEEALKWAALERLPTFNRLRKGILTLPAGEMAEIDVKKLGLLERKALLDRLLKVAEEDNERFLLKLKNRLDRVGIELPKIEVRYEDLEVEAKTHVGNRGLQTVLNSTINILESIANTFHILPSRKKTMTILHNISGIIKPHRMTLLLGPPGSGKSTFLLALAGKLDPNLKVSGRITYNGHEMNEFVPQRTAAYISQYDLHLGEMTVRETLNFSARCQGVGFRFETMAELARREKAASIKPDPDIDVFMKASAIGGHDADVVTDYYLKILGLESCADTLVGNQMLRGISGGERKRVTTGEMLVGPRKALFMDEISTGLDSSTTYQIINSLKHYIHIMGGTALISLLQPAPETFELFDDIILLSEGQIAYQGPRENILEFFESLGFKCPERKGVADFLQEVTSRKDQEQYWARTDQQYKYVPVKEFAESFHSFHIGRAIKNEISVPFDKSKSHPNSLTTTKYGASKKELFKAVFDREVLLMKRNSFIYIFSACQLMIMALITTTLFLRTNMHRDSETNGGIYLGALFFTILMIMFNGYAELQMTISNLPVFYKQREILLFPAWAYSLPSWILKIPFSFLNAFIWVLITYYAIGFDPNVGRLFKQFMLLVVLNQMASSLFRFIAGVSRHVNIASTLGTFALLIVMVLGGFVLSRENVKKWWIWGYWFSPMMYVQNAIAVNEFLGHSWSKILSGSSESLGVQVLKSRGIFPDAKWYWIGFGALIGYTLVFNVLYMLALTFLNEFGKTHPIISEEALKEKQANLTGEIIEGTSNGGNILKSHDSVINESSSVETKKGMVLPFTPLSITFEDIRYAVDMPVEVKAQGENNNKLELLKGLTGSFRPGVLTALMGVSGAGKTTLMDVLAGRKTGGYIEGNITINGYPKNQETFARISGYCEQNDIHSPHVTVYESLLFSAWLRLPSEVDSTTRKMFVEEVMELIELDSIRGALVGLPGVNGLSTEQRKRLTIAVELVANPSIIFMDEPTSGLDARAAAIVMRTVRNTVNTGRTVVCTIHQPSIDIFESFDELFLMKRGGEEIYVGPLGHHSSQLIKYFEGIDGVKKIRDGYNPATWMLEVSSSAQEEMLGIDFPQVYKNSELYERNKNMIKEISRPPPNSSDLHFPTQYSQSFLIQSMACLWKQNLSYWRNPSYTAIRFFFTTFIALLFGTIFWDLGTKMKTRQDLFNSMGALYCSVLFIGNQNASTVQPVVAIERTVFYRERAAGMYSPLPYAFGQVLIEIPYIFVQAMIYGIIVYSMIGFEWNAAKFFWFIFFMYFSLLYFTFYGMMAVGMTPNQSIASIVFSAFLGLWNLFSGYLIPRPKIPVWWVWYYWICPVSYTLYGLIVSQYGDIKESLDSPKEPVDEFIRNYFGFRHDLLGFVAAIVVGFAVLFAFSFAFSIKKFNFQKR